MSHFLGFLLPCLQYVLRQNMEHSISLCWDTHCWSLNSWEEESLVPNVNIIFGWFIITTEIHGRVLHDDNDETATIGSS